MVNKFLIGIFLSALISFFACDPGHHGTSFIRNQTSYALKLKYKTRSEKDTTMIIPPNTLVDVFHFGGLGAGRFYDCCPCEFLELSLQPEDTAKILIKSPTESNNWKITNPNKKTFSGKQIDCEFIVTSTDIH